MRILIVNGVSGCGKDTLINGLKNTKKLSVIDPIKEAFMPFLGSIPVRGSATEDADRKLLSDVYESVMVNRPLMVMDWLIKNIYMRTPFEQSFDTVAIIARQPRDIMRIKSLFDSCGHDVFTVYISRPGTTNRFNNDGDNSTSPDAMDYDLYFVNDYESVGEAQHAFRKWVENMGCK